MQSASMPIGLNHCDVPFVLFKSSNSLLRLANRGLSAKTVAKSIRVLYSLTKAAYKLITYTYNKA